MFRLKMMAESREPRFCDARMGALGRLGTGAGSAPSTLAPTSAVAPCDKKNAQSANVVSTSPISKRRFLARATAPRLWDCRRAVDRTASQQAALDAVLRESNSASCLFEAPNRPPRANVTVACEP